MLQGKQVDRLVAKVMRLGDVYGQLVVRKEVPQKVFITTNNSTQEAHDGLQWGSDFTYADFWFEVQGVEENQFYCLQYTRFHTEQTP